MGLTKEQGRYLHRRILTLFFCSVCNANSMNLRYLIASTVQTQIELESMRQDFMTYGKLKINRKTFSMKIVC